VGRGCHWIFLATKRSDDRIMRGAAICCAGIGCGRHFWAGIAVVPQGGGIVSVALDFSGPQGYQNHGKAGPRFTAVSGCEAVYRSPHGHLADGVCALRVRTRPNEALFVRTLWHRWAGRTGAFATSAMMHRAAMLFAGRWCVVELRWGILARVLHTPFDAIQADRC